MSTRSIVNRAKLEAWASHFGEQKASGLTIADWCQRNGISRTRVTKVAQVVQLAQPTRACAYTQATSQ